jgi:hypothetical protein
MGKGKGYSLGIKYDRTLEKRKVELITMYRHVTNVKGKTCCIILGG